MGVKNIIGELTLNGVEVATVDHLGGGSIGLEYTLNSTGTEYSVSGIGTCTDTDITIPAIYKGLPVTSIGDRAFYNCISLTSVKIGDSVTSIGDSAFQRCTDLTTLSIGAGVAFIDLAAFADCAKLTDIYFNARSLSLPSPSWDNPALNNNVFARTGRSGAGISVIIGPKVTKIPDRLFYPNTDTDGTSPKIISVLFDSNSACERIDSLAFYGCSTFTTIVIPDCVTSIDGKSFLGCDNLTIYCEAENRPEGWAADWNCRDLESGSTCPVVWGYINDFEGVNNNLVVRPGEGENSIQQTGTGAQALSKASVALGKDTAILNFKAGVTNINRASELTYEVTNTTITFSSPTITDLAISELCFRYFTADSKYYNYVREHIDALPFAYNIPEADIGSVTADSIKVDYLIAITNAEEDAGLAAISAGFGSTAAGLGATALGYSTRALHHSTFAAGYSNESAADGASTVGALNLNKSVAGFVSGKNNSALGGYDHFMAGNGNTIEGGAHGAHNAAIGQDNTIKSGTQCGFVFGKSNQASGNYPQAGGVGCKAHGTQRVFGKYNVLDTEGKYVDIIGWGTSSTPKNIYTLDTSGNASFSGNVTAARAAVSGKITAGSADFSGDVTATVEGKTISLSTLNTKIGNLDSTYLRKAGNVNRTIVLCGLDSNADTSQCSLVWGYGKSNEHYISTSNFSLLGGANNKISGSTSSAVLGEGNTLKSSSRTLLTGAINQVEYAPYSLVTGANNKILGTEEKGYGKNLVAGEGNQANALYQAIVGKYNLLDAEALFIVGNGENNTSGRSNAFVVKKDGTGYLGDKKVLTEGTQNISGLKFSGGAGLTDVELVNDGGDYYLRVYGTDNNGKPDGINETEIGGGIISITGTITAKDFVTTNGASVVTRNANGDIPLEDDETWIEESKEVAVSAFAVKSYIDDLSPVEPSPGLVVRRDEEGDVALPQIQDSTYIEDDMHWAVSGHAVKEYVDGVVSPINTQLGDIDSALDAIIAIQESLIGGNA